MTGYRSGVPDNWFVDPVNLGVPGVRRPRAGREDDNPLAMADGRALLADRSRGVLPREGRLDARREEASAPRATCATSASSTRCRTTSASASGAA